MLNQKVRDQCPGSTRAAQLAGQSGVNLEVRTGARMSHQAQVQEVGLRTRMIPVEVGGGAFRNGSGTKPKGMAWLGCGILAEVQAGAGTGGTGIINSLLGT